MVLQHLNLHSDALRSWTTRGNIERERSRHAAAGEWLGRLQLHLVEHEVA
jgi:hypothetical protein